MRRKQENLTEKEFEVLSFLGHGYSNKEIAQRLFVTEHTVKAHLTNIYAKLGVTNRLSAVLLLKKSDITPHQGLKQP